MPLLRLMKKYRFLALIVFPLVLISSSSVHRVLRADTSPLDRETVMLNGKESFKDLAAGPCTFSNGGLNPKPFTESGVPAPPGHMWSELQHDAGNLAEANVTAGVFDRPRLADDFTISTTCTISTISFYSIIDPGNSTGAQFTSLTLRIWQGVPEALTSSLVFGDLSTNRLVSSVDTGYLRIHNTVAPPPGVVPVTTRKIWRNTANIGVTLSPGTYWLEWAATATGSNGSNVTSLAPTSTVDGARGVAGDNARALFIPGGWAQIIDLGSPLTAPDVNQDLPFDVVGTPAAPLPTPTPTPTPSEGVFTSFTGPAVTIPGGPGIGGQLDLPFVVGSACTITDVNFRFDGAVNGAGDATNVGLNRTWIGLADISLVSPSRTSVTLKSWSTTGPGCRNNHLSQVTFDDDGGHPPIDTVCDTAGGSAAPFPPGTYKPNTPLSAFDGESAGGTWLLRIRHNLINSGAVRAFTVHFTCDRDSNADVSGRVNTPDGRPLRAATVMITDPLGNRRTVTTGSFGFYSFEGVPAGSMYTVSVSSKRYRFAPRVLSVTNSLTDIDFVGLE